MAKKSEEYLALLEDPDVKRWHKNTKKGSHILASVYLRSLGRFCREVQLSPAQFIQLSQEEMENRAQDYIEKLEDSINPKSGKPYSPSYIENCLTAIRAWAAWNRKSFQRTIKIKDANSTPTLDGERALTQEELQVLLYSDSTPLRTRASIALIIFSGCRPEVQGNYLGLEGLRIKDFPEMKITDKGEVVFSKVPTAVIVRKELSKIHKQYLTFLFEEGCLILKEYLERRIKEGERLTRESGIIVSSAKQSQRANWAFGKKDTSPFLATPKITEQIRQSMRTVSIPFRPYVLRVSFDTALITAEGKGMITHAFQQFIMGHAGDIERTYTLSKHVLPEEIMEDIRIACRKASQFVQTSRLNKSEDMSLLKTMREGFLLGKGYTPEQLQKMDLEGMTNDEFFRLLKSNIDNAGKEQVETEQQNVKLPLRNSSSTRHESIPISQLKQFLSAGCRYMDQYTDEDGKRMAIVELGL